MKSRESEVITLMDVSYVYFHMRELLYGIECFQTCRFEVSATLYLKFTALHTLLISVTRSPLLPVRSSGSMNA